MILDMIQEWFKELLIDGIISNLTGMFDTLALGCRVVLAVTFQKVDAAPHAQAAAQGDDQSLQNVDSVSKKAHIHISFRSVELLG